MNEPFHSIGTDSIKAAEPSSFRGSLGPVLLLASIFFMNFLARIVMAPLMPAIERDLGLSHAEAGSFFFLITSGYFVSVTASGFLAARCNHRRIIILSAAAVGLVLLGVSVARTAWAMWAALFVLGMATGIYIPSGLATLTSLVHPKHWGKGLAIHDLGPNLGFVAAPLITEALLGWSSWQAVPAVLGGISLLLGLCFARFGRGGEFPGQAPTLPAFLSLFRDPGFWIMMILFTVGIGGAIGVYTMLPLYLVAEHGMEREWANTLIALSRVSGVGMSFVAGWASDRLGARRTLTGVLLLTGISTLLLSTASGSWLIFLVFLQPALSTCFFPPALVALSSIGPPQALNVSISLTIPLSFLVGGGALPTLIGVLADAGAFSLGLGLVGALVLLGCWLPLRIPAKEL